MSSIAAPLVSIIIPCYNCESFIRRAIECVLKQSFISWELILVNNNSTDDTPQILYEYQKLHPEKVSVLHETKKGAPAARNKGLYEARGEWIQFLDADDEILPDKIKGQLEIARKHSPSVIASPYTITGVKDGIRFSTTRALQSNDFWLGLINSELGITSANLWNKDSLLSVDGWDDNLISSQEYDLMFRMLKLNPIVGFDQRNSTIINIESGTSVSRGGDKEKGKKILDTRIGLRLRIKEYLKQNDILTEERYCVLDAFVYKQLYENYRFRPDYVKEKLSHLDLNIPFALKLKGAYFMFKMNLKRFLKIK